MDSTQVFISRSRLLTHESVWRGDIVAELPRGSKSGFIEEAVSIVDAARDRGLILRVAGACVIRLHCHKTGHLHDALKRELSDIDFVTYAKFVKGLRSLLAQRGYIANDRFNVLHGTVRQIFIDEVNRRTVDIFIDQLDMCHKVDFRKRLELDYPTITLADFLLEKLQIVKITEKDVKDLIVVLREHDLGDQERETIDAEYISKRFSDDWGFYYTTTTNLGKAKDFLPAYEVLTEEDRLDVRTKIDTLLSIIENEPKTFGWKMRAKVGPKKQWYHDVTDLRS